MQVAYIVKASCGRHYDYWEETQFVTFSRETADIWVEQQKTLDKVIGPKVEEFHERLRVESKDYRQAKPQPEILPFDKKVVPKYKKPTPEQRAEMRAIDAENSQRLSEACQPVEEWMADYSTWHKTRRAELLSELDLKESDVDPGKEYPLSYEIEEVKVL